MELTYRTKKHRPGTCCKKDTVNNDLQVKNIYMISCFLHIMDFEKDFRSILTEGGLDLESILKRHSLQKQDDISRKWTFGPEKDSYKAVKQEIQEIVLEAFSLYIDRYGAILKQEACEWLYHELEDQQKRPLHNPAFCSDLITTPFNRQAEGIGIHKAINWRKNYRTNGEYEVDEERSAPYLQSTVYFRDEGRIIGYAFQRFGKNPIEDDSGQKPDKAKNPGFGPEGGTPQKDICLEPDPTTALMGIRDAEFYLSENGVEPEDARRIILDKRLGAERVIFLGLEKKPAHFYQNQLDMVAVIYRMSEN
jgi:hypothetical protein